MSISKRFEMWFVIGVVLVTVVMAFIFSPKECQTNSETIIPASATQEVKAIYVPNEDIDGDGIAIDEMVAYGPIVHVSFGYMEDGTIKLAAPIILQSETNIENIFTDDADSDGDPDIVVASKVNGRETYYENLGGGKFRPTPKDYGANK